MPSLKQSISSEMFVAATGLAALIHSTWTLSTLFGGSEPIDPIKYIEWVIPGLLVAFAMDIGQIMTSREIREQRKKGQRPWAKYGTFVIFAVATYYLQWLYLIHHVPQMTLGSGVGSDHAMFASSLKDLAIWIVPAFLPLSTLLYTLSAASPAPAEIIVDQTAVVVSVEPQLRLSERSEQSAKERIIAYLEANPDAKATEIRDGLGLGISTVYRELAKIKDESNGN